MTIKKSLTNIVAAALICGSTIMPAKAEEKQSNYGVDINMYNDLSYSTTSIKPKLPQNWTRDYDPLGGSMHTKNSGPGYAWNIGLGLEPYVKPTESVRIGIPIIYRVIPTDMESFLPDKNLGGTDVEWWDDVALARIREKRKFPEIGLSVQVNAIEVEATVQNYEIYQQDYEGIDNFGGQNSARPIRNTTLEKGLSKRISIFYHVITDEEKHSWGTTPRSDDRTIGIFYEQIGDKSWSAGLAFKCSFTQF
jgi:hypothetical protein